MGIIRNLQEKIRNFFIYDRKQREELQRGLYKKLKNDSTLTPEQFDKLYDIIHYGAYCGLYDFDKEEAKRTEEQFNIKIVNWREYTNEARLYSSIINKNKKHWDNIDILYNIFKKEIL